MAQYPLQEGNDTAVADGLNYLLSGPAGLGQDFNGYEQWTPGYLTGNFRIPYTQLSFDRDCTGTSGDAFVSANPNAKNIMPGMSVSGYGIAGGTTVISIGAATAGGVQVNLSAAITQDISNGLTFSPNPVPQLFVDDINCSSAVQLDDYTFQYNFTAPVSPPPFQVGNNINGDGWANDWYNGRWPRQGVIACTTTYVVVSTINYSPGKGDDLAGGVVKYFVVTDVPDVNALSTDCNSKIVVNGGNDRVFISAQLNNIITYTATTPSDLSYGVAINRYKGYPNNNPANPGYVFDLDKLIAKRVYTFSGLTGTNITLDNIETIFSNFPDTNIAPAYYWYILDVSYQVTNGGDLQINESELGLRSMSTQTVKQ